MQKLINGIIEFRRNVQAGYREAFGRLAVGQTPDALFIACSDSRVVPNTFASTNPGDLFVLRNVGNLVPPCGGDGFSEGDKAEAAAVEYAVLELKVADIIVCGHSECGAMRALLDNRRKLVSPNLRKWLRHSDTALERLRLGQSTDPRLTEHNQLSQLNVLLQMEHIKSYPFVQERIERGTLAVHGWWFEIANADVFAYHRKQKKFVLIDNEDAVQRS
jgi:carbonic anhydrase